MKKPIVYSLFYFAILFLSLKPNLSYANHAAGGQLVYEWLSDSTYRFFFTFYRDCGGDAEPSTFPLCLNNTCTNTTTTATMTKFSTTGIGPGYGCPKYKTRCDSPTSAISGVIKWTYSAIITLPARCNNWRFYTYAGHRNSNSNILNSTNTDLYLETTFNNAVFQGNSTPYFTIQSFPYACINTPISFNSGAIDPNNDSVTTELVTPLTGVSSCGNTPVNTISSGSGYTIAINTASGNISFTASQLGLYSFLIRVKEYRGGILVGSTMSEMEFMVLNCIVPITSHRVDTNLITGGTHILDTIIGCPGQTLNFCFSGKSSDTAANIILSDSHSSSMPGSTVSYSPQANDSVRGCITWTPTSGYSGELFVAIKDSTCRLGTALQTFTTLSIPFRIQPKTQILGDTSICANGAAMLLAIGGGTCTWSILPGGSPGSLSCMNCVNPIATPIVTSQYAVITTGNAYCGNTKDTVTVTILPFTHPSLTITVSPDSNVTKNSLVNFLTHVSNCSSPFFQWQKNGLDITGAVYSAWNSLTLSDHDIISCKLSCKDTCPLPKDTFSNSINMHITDTTNSIGKTCGADQLSIFPNPNNGNFTIGLSKLKDKNVMATIDIIDMMGQVVYKEILTNDGGDKKHFHLEIAKGIYTLRINTGSQYRTMRFTVD